MFVAYLKFGMPVLLVLILTAMPCFAHLTQEQKERAEKLISLFENGSTEFHYDYIEALGDGRGYTCGRTGFTTATGDAYLLIKQYTEEVENSPLAIYLTRLEELSVSTSDSILGLEGFEESFRQAVKDPIFRALQDELQDQIYYYPAVKIAEEIGLKSALAYAIFYDTILQHGNGEDPDSIKGIVSKVEETYGENITRSPVDEKRFLAAFLIARRNILINPTNVTSQAVWAKSVGRVEVFFQLLRERNYRLKGPIQLFTTDYFEVVD